MFKFWRNSEKKSKPEIRIGMQTTKNGGVNFVVITDTDIRLVLDLMGKDCFVHELPAGGTMELTGERGMPDDE